MYRGTTPTLVYKFNSNFDLSTIKEVWVTLENPSKELTLNINDVSIDNENKTIGIILSQEDTLEFSSGKVKTQIRLLDDKNKAYATNVKILDMNNILKEGVIGG